MSRESSLEVVARFRNSVAHGYWGSELVFSSKNKIFSIKNLNDPEPEKIGEIPWGLVQYPSHLRIVDRVLKNSILQVHKTANLGYLISNGNSWWQVDHGKDARRIAPFSATRPMNRGLCESRNGITFVAEYTLNPDRDPVRIYRTDDLFTFEVAWEFGRNEIRHVHALIPDPETENRIWVLTGDYGAESAIFYTDDEFATLKYFLGGNQESRATDMIISDGWLYWGMDSELETSFVMRVAKDNPGEPERLYELPGPAYYMSRNKAGGIYLGTTVEPGASVKDDFGHLIRYSGDGCWEEVLRRKNDLFPQFGIFYFPKGILPENFVVYSQRALRPNEGCMTIARDHSWN
jgi:hypothetical protein